MNGRKKRPLICPLSLSLSLSLRCTRTHTCTVYRAKILSTSSTSGNSSESFDQGSPGLGGRPTARTHRITHGRCPCLSRGPLAQHQHNMFQEQNEKPRGPL
ncbi:unnamed protein product [Musa banksii]